MEYSTPKARAWQSGAQGEREASLAIIRRCPELERKGALVVELPSPERDVAGLVKAVNAPLLGELWGVLRNASPLNSPLHRVAGTSGFMNAPKCKR